MPDGEKNVRAEGGRGKRQQYAARKNQVRQRKPTRALGTGALHSCGVPVALFVLGLMVRPMLLSAGYLWEIYALCLLGAGAVFVGLAARRETWRDRAMGCCYVVAIVMLFVRFFCPVSIFLLPFVPLLGFPEHYGYTQALCYAYDGGLGTWVWIVLHAAGYLLCVRLFASGKRWPAVILAVAWTLATMTFVSGAIEFASRGI